MRLVPPETILVVFLLFCRIGGCLMLMPGFSSSRVPVQVRLFIAMAVTLALTPLLLPTVNTAVPVSDLAAPKVMRLIFSETLIGVLIGLIGRLFYMALQFMATAAAQLAGFNPVGGAPVEDVEPIPALAAFITLTATVLLFVTDQHWEVLRALLASYAVLPITEPVVADFGLAKVADALSSTFILALQISSPFVVYALIINLMVGLANKLVPQVPVYFISVPFVLAGGLLLLYLTIGEALRLFMAGFTAWLTTAEP
jgi:flagellar biosynthetic protein FliR